MIMALRYMEKDGGHWEVQTDDTIENHTSLRQFRKYEEIVSFATRTIQEPDVWVVIAKRRDHENGD